MLAAVLLASTVATAAYIPPDAFGLWEGDGGMLTVTEAGFDVSPYADLPNRDPKKCVFVQQVPGVYQFAIACDDGESYTLTMRDTGGKGAIEDATLEFDGLLYRKVLEND